MPRSRAGNGRSGQVHEVVGVVPAAGRGTRLGRLPCSKELYPVALHRETGSADPRCKVVSEYLLEQFSRAGARKTYLVIREGKWDIPGYFRDGTPLHMPLAYLVIDGSCGPPDTVDRAYSFLKGQTVAFGFPDIVVTPGNVFQRLRRSLESSNADATLSLFRAPDPWAMDMVDVDETGRIHAMVLKPKRTALTYAWATAMWRPSFTEFLHEYLRRHRRSGRRSVANQRRIDAGGDLPMGAVLQAAIREGLMVNGVRFPTGTYLDIGTPDNLSKAIRTL